MGNVSLIIAIVILSLIVLILIMKIITTPLTYLSKLDYSQIVSREIKIPVGDIEIYSCLYLPKYALEPNSKPKSSLPLVILNTGWGLNIDKPYLKQWAVFVCLNGPYACLTYDYRGLGKTPGKLIMTTKITEDIPKIIDFAFKLPEIDSNRVGFVGLSFGASIALTKAYSDERIKAVASIVGLNSMFGNFNRKPKNLRDKITLKMLHHTGVKTEILSEEDNKIMSPAYVMQKERIDLNKRVFMENAKDDSCIDFEEFKKNQEILNLPPEQYLVLEKGGHTGKHQEVILLARLSQFFHSKL